MDKPNAQSTEQLDTRALRRFYRQVEGLDSNIVLAFYMDALRGALNRATDAHVAVTAAQSANLGKWIGKVATAILPPDDPRVAELTAELKKEIDAISAVVPE